MYYKSIEIVNKIATLCFKSFGKAHERSKHCVLLATPSAYYRTHCWPAHAQPWAYHNNIQVKVVNSVTHAAAASISVQIDAGCRYSVRDIYDIVLYTALVFDQIWIIIIIIIHVYVYRFFLQVYGWLILRVPSYYLLFITTHFKIF
jgi:hypothetical protein